MTVARIVPGIRGPLLFSTGGVVLEPPRSSFSLVRVAVGIDSIDSPTNYLSGLPRTILDYLEDKFRDNRHWAHYGKWQKMSLSGKLEAIFSVELSELKRSQKEQRKNRTQVASFFATSGLKWPTSLGLNLKNKGDLRAYFQRRHALSSDQRVYFCPLLPDPIIPIAKLLKPYTDTP